MADFLKDIANYLTPKIKTFVFNALGELEIEVEPKKLFKLIIILKEDEKLAFEQLIDITAIDYPEEEKRFKVVYHFLTIKYNQRLRVVTYVNDEEQIKSITSIYPHANWYEREIFDMFGIGFADHPDMRRILTDYDFKGHPLRKDYV